MTSRRTWMLGLALGAFFTVNSTSDAFAQVPRQISYQGQLLSDNQPASGPQTITINYYVVGSQTPLFSETFNNVDVRDGIFNLMLGSVNGGGFPASMDFSERYEIGVTVNNTTELTPRTALLSAPYALNAERVNGFSVSQIPTAGSILVLDNSGMIPASALPTQPNFVAGDNITITEDTLTNTFTINATGGTVAGVTSITAGQGLTASSSSGNVSISIAPNGINATHIAPGSITGSALSTPIAGEGLFQDIFGNLNVGVDNTSIVVVNDRLQVGALGPGNFDPNAIQSRITGTAASGDFITGVNANGTVTTATVESDPSLLRTLNGNDVFLRINPDFTNIYTAQQNFDGGIITNGIVNNGLLTQNGNVAFGNGLSPMNVLFNTGGGMIDFTGATLQNVGAPVNGGDVVTLDFLTTSQGNMVFAGDITGNPEAIEINAANAGIGDRLVTGINAATTTIVNAAIANDLTIDGGTIDNTPIGANVASTGNFTTLTATDLTAIGAINLGDGDDNVTFNVGTGVLDFGGAALTNLGTAVAGTDAVTLDQLNNSVSTLTFTGDIIGTPSAIEIDPASIGIGDRLITGINAGTTTIGNAAIADDLTISGGTIDDTPIGATTASTGNFTTLTATSVSSTDLATTGAVTLGDGDDNIAFNAGTGSINFGGAVLTNLSDGIAGSDAVTVDQLNSTIGAQGFMGDIIGSPSMIEIDPSSAGIGDRLVAGINLGTTTILDAAIDNALTIEGGSINATDIGLATPGIAIFSDLTATGETMLATTSGNVVIGTTVDTDIASLEVVEDVTSGTEGVAAYIRTTTTGGATRSLGIVVESTGDGTADLTRPASNAILGVAKYNGGLVTDQQLMGVVGKAEPGANGITAIGTVGQASDANALINMGVLGIARNGGSVMGGSNVGVVGAANASDLDLATIGATAPTAGVLAYNNSTDGSALWAMSPTAGVAVEVAGGAVTATAAASGSVSNRFADTYTVTGGPLGVVTIDNALVTPTSTVIVTFEDNSGGAILSHRVITTGTGSFQVEFSADAEDGDEIHYMIINH